MTERLKERNEIEEKYKWDLTTLFSSDEEWERALAETDDLLREIMECRGTLHTAQNIRKFLDLETELSGKAENLFCYANLRKSEDTRAEAAQIMYGRIMSKYVGMMTELSFAEPEILENDETVLQEMVEDPVLAPYRFLMEEKLRLKAHTLSAKEERILAGLGEVMAVPGEVSENLMDADLTFAPVKDENGREQEVTGSNYILLQMSDDRTLRRNSFLSYYDGYRKHINTLAATYAGAVKAAAGEAVLRNWSSSRAMSMGADNIPEAVYDNLIDTVRRHLPLMYRYVRLRRRLLGLDEIHYYDVYAPLCKGSAKRYTYEEAKETVLDAIRPLGEDYCRKVAEGLESRWIDVYPNKGKSTGAFSSGTYDSNPYILTNFTGTLDSVSTIAHEMGHSMHTWHSNTHQPRQYAGYTLFVAEVASTVNENLLIDQLLEKTEDPQERLALLNQYLEGFKGTVYRQTMFAEFEKKAHAMYESGEALNPAALNALYLQLVKDYFGEDMVMDDEVQYEWARIPHFYRPFYVYVYATGYSSAAAISEMILRGDEGAVQRYIEFLSMGGSAYPLDELKHAGVDLTTPAPIETALAKFERLLEDAERTADRLGL
ncbi:MAG: oligoendopeptidase F [Solobacterium sp.]|nr:oligoendopeptidase F [Solobacterium sp.]